MERARTARSTVSTEQTDFLYYSSKNGQLKVQIPLRVGMAAILA